MFLLDTDISIYLLKGEAPLVVDRLRALPADIIGTTAINAAELRYGAVHSQRPNKNIERVALFLAPLAVLPFDDEAAAHFARIKHDLASGGNLVGPMDLLIASIARASGATIVTNNVREFSRIKGLEVENWLER